jgi:hypothetical protein
MLHAITHVLDTNSNRTASITRPSNFYFLQCLRMHKRRVHSWDIDNLKTAIMNKARLGHLKPFDIILRRVRVAFWPA